MHIHTISHVHAHTDARTLTLTLTLTLIPINQTYVLTTPMTVDMTLEKFLQQLDLQAYLSAFVEDGYDEVEDVVHMTLQDIKGIKGMKIGHAKRIFRHVTKLKS